MAARRSLDLLLLGPVGAGKGTQARRIADRYHIPHVASGDLLRAHRREGTPLGQQAQDYMDRGALVPDDLVVQMVVERIRQADAGHGFLLDGFPRTLVQAEALDAELAGEHRAVGHALYLAVPADVLERRAASRWTCRVCSTTYSYEVNPPRVPGICDLEGGELYQREDDRPEGVRQRVRVYFEETVPVIDHYRRKGVLAEVEGTLSIDDVTAMLIEQIERAD